MSDYTFRQWSDLYQTIFRRTLNARGFVIEGHRVLKDVIVCLLIVRRRRLHGTDKFEVCIYNINLAIRVFVMGYTSIDPISVCFTDLFDPISVPINNNPHKISR